MIEWLKRWWRRHIVSDDPWYAWADERLDEIERDQKWLRENGIDDGPLP